MWLFGKPVLDRGRRIFGWDFVANIQM